MTFEFKLDQVLEELEISKTKLSNLSGIRPATVIDLSKGKLKRLELKTMNPILDTLNIVAKEKGIAKLYTLDSIVEYYPVEEADK
ncbi:helix-turn-helix transcriptional regulator [Rossellomorea sp. DA94]|uniref:helix-turn-helix domain-containing protein n=1 Tax=Rossellomorea sp. DA94 TaxID=3038653 RepID=UPI00244CCC04|nr:helix-turn-helix transcriptional regulator [Rossellomorea sp. DA94]WGG47660.1 helix-turn-helix transcriptional regulator [Rossellomorea sp. DA94]